MTLLKSFNYFSSHSHQLFSFTQKFLACFPNMCCSRLKYIKLVFLKILSFNSDILHLRRNFYLKPRYKLICLLFTDFVFLPKPFLLTIFDLKTSIFTFDLRFLLSSLVRSFYSYKWLFWWFIYDFCLCFYFLILLLILILLIILL